MSIPTPITDAAACHVSVEPYGGILVWPNPLGAYVPVEVARQLERELAASRVEVARLIKERDSLSESVAMFSSQSTALYGERDTLRARVAELEADKVRLDWLEKHMVGTGYDGKILMTILLPMLPIDDYEKPTLRAAVDMKRKETT